MKNGVAERYNYFLIPLFVLGTVTVCSGAPKLILSNDGPAILDTYISFNATLLNPDRAEYIIYWNEGGPFSRSAVEKLNQTNHYTSNWKLKYNSNSKYIGQFAVTVNVGYFSFLQWFVTVDTQITRYTITDRFTGSLDVWQDGKLRQADPDILVSTKNEVTLIANVHDPSHYLETAVNVTYSWYNQTSFIANTTSQVLKKNFTKESEYSYNVTLTAVFNSTDFNQTEATNITTVVKEGRFKTKFKVKSAIANLTVAGPTWFPHGKLLKLNVSCAGSSPYTYCWMLKNGPYNRTGNETCPSSQTTNDCEFRITRYFQEPGIYSLLVIMENDVSKIVNQSTINVYIVHRKQQLSIIVVPVSCSIIAVVLIVFGIAYYIENQVKYTVEVADFDFGQDTEIPYMTFVERLRNAMSSPGTNTLLVPSNSDDDQEPILTSD